MTAPLISARRLTKRFGATLALDHVDFEVNHGEAVALLGENGAGKSTFCKVLVGLVRPDGGRVDLDGRALAFGAPHESLRRGIGYIPQELAYIPDLSVSENLVLGQWPQKHGFTSQRRILARARQIADDVGTDVDLSAPMRSLSLGERQLVDITKAVCRDVRLLILDEPTAALNSHDAQRLFEVMKRLTATGVATIYISHRLDEVAAVSTRTCVFRDGRLVAALPSAAPRQTIIGHMLGRTLTESRRERGEVPKRPRPASVLAIDSWTYDGQPRLSDVSLDVRGGEILSIYGLRGSGGEVVADGLGGVRPGITGSVTVAEGTTSPWRDPRAALDAGVAYVPADRKQQGLVLTLPIRTNLTLLTAARFSRWGLLRASAEKRVALRLVGEFDIRCRSLDQPTMELSGGNQQKVMVASRLAARPRALVLHEPTRGVDVGARAEIHRILREAARRGLAVVCVTSDVDEACSVGDRLLVLRDGRVEGELADDRRQPKLAAALAAGSSS